MKIWAILAVAALAISYLWWDGKTKYDAGYDAAKNMYLEQMKEKDDRILKLQEEATKANVAKEREIAKLRRQADAKIGKLLRTNASLQQWWDNRTPDPAADFAYGLPDSAP